MKILLEGRPGSGKTTVAARLMEILKSDGVAVRGFVTREIREQSRRVGFSFETADGGAGILAHVDFTGPPRVGKYGVDLDEFERVVVPVISSASRHEVVLIDELGKMELASKPFRVAALSLFEDGEAVVVATVHAFRHPVTNALKGRPNVELIPVTSRNRDELPGAIASRVRARLEPRLTPPGDASP